MNKEAVKIKLGKVVSGGVKVCQFFSAGGTFLYYNICVSVAFLPNYIEATVRRPWKETGYPTRLEFSNIILS